MSSRRQHRRAVTVRPPRQIREHPSLSDATLIMTMEDMIHATFGSEESNKVDFKLFETVLTILGRRLNLLDQKVSLVDIDVGDEDKLTHGGIELISPYQMSGRKNSLAKEDATYVLMAFLSKVTDDLSERISKDRVVNLDTASFIDLLDNNSKIKLYDLVEDVESKAEGFFFVDEYLKPFLDNLKAMSDSFAITIDLEDNSDKIVKSDITSKKISRTAVKSFERAYHVLGSEVIDAVGHLSPVKRKSHIEEEALAILGLLRSTFPVRKVKHFINQKPPGSKPPEEGLAWPPTPSRPWPAQVSKKDPPLGWPSSGIAWPPPEGTPWPARIKIPKGMKPPVGWPVELPWPPTDGMPWPSEVSGKFTTAPSAPKGWPEEMPWLPTSESPWAEGVKILRGMKPPSGWPKDLAWPPPPEFSWPSGMSWGTDAQTSVPPGWPAELPWPPSSGTVWPKGVSMPGGMVAPQGWSEDWPWPPEPGTTCPSGASWPDVNSHGLPRRDTMRSSTLQLTDEGDRIIAQRVPSRTGSKTASTRVGTVECVTVSQFDLLKKAVNNLQKISAPIPMPTMPLNKKLIKEVTSGSASLTDTMEVMKVVSRVKAMEDAVGRLSEMVSVLAAGIGNKVKEQETELQVVKPPHSPTLMEAPSPRYQMPAGSIKPSVASMDVPCVTRAETANALGSLRELLSQEIQEMKHKITAAADASVLQGKIIMEKLEEVVHISLRMDSLQEMVAEYYQQLEGLEAGITIQIKTFNDQLSLLKNDLDCGLNLMANVNSNKETFAVMDLTERYEGLVGDLDGLLHLHSQLDDKQRSIADELRHLIHAVESVSEQKADHDELADGLKDKADQSTLAGILTEQVFQKAMDGIKENLEACYVKFNKQDQVWHEALSDLLAMIDQKADYSQVFSWKDLTLENLQKLHCQVKLLAMAVGEPKAALLARQLAKDAFCGACAESAYMEVEDSCMMRPDQTTPDDSLCIGSYKKLFEKEDDKRHFCKRWVGGSHTLIQPMLVSRGRAETSDLQVTPMRRYLAQGADGKVYHCASEMKACEECNVLHRTPRDPPPPASSSGSHRPSSREVMPLCDRPLLPIHSVHTMLPMESFIETSPERKSSIVSRVRGINSSLDIVATHGKINSDKLEGNM